MHFHQATAADADIKPTGPNTSKKFLLAVFSVVLLISIIALGMMFGSSPTMTVTFVFLLLSSAAIIYFTIQHAKSIEENQIKSAYETWHERLLSRAKDSCPDDLTGKTIKLVSPRGIGSKLMGRIIGLVILPNPLIKESLEVLMKKSSHKIITKDDLEKAVAKLDDKVKSKLGDKTTWFINIIFFIPERYKALARLPVFSELIKPVGVAFYDKDVVGGGVDPLSDGVMLQASSIVPWGELNLLDVNAVDGLDLSRNIIVEQTSIQTMHNILKLMTAISFGVSQSDPLIQKLLLLKSDMAPYQGYSRPPGGGGAAG